MIMGFFIHAANNQTMKTFPEFELPTPAGSTLSAGELGKHPLSLITFYKASCDTSVYLLELLNDFGQRLALPHSPFWLVSQDSAEETRRFLTITNIRLPAAIDFPDYRLSRQLDFQSVPALYLVDRSEKILFHSVGFVKDEFQRILQRIAIKNGRRDVLVFQDEQTVAIFKPG